MLESARVVTLYNETIVPKAVENIKAAQAAASAQKLPFVSVIEAQRNLVVLRDRFFEATADCRRRLAALHAPSADHFRPHGAAAGTAGAAPASIRHEWPCRGMLSGTIRHHLQCGRSAGGGRMLFMVIERFKDRDPVRSTSGSASRGGRCPTGCATSTVGSRSTSTAASS